MNQLQPFVWFISESLRYLLICTNVWGMVQGHLVQAHKVCPEFDMGLENTAVYLGLTKLKKFSVKPSHVIHCTFFPVTCLKLYGGIKQGVDLLAVRVFATQRACVSFPEIYVDFTADKNSQLHQGLCLKSNGKILNQELLLKHFTWGAEWYFSRYLNCELFYLIFTVTKGTSCHETSDWQI